MSDPLLRNVVVDTNVHFSAWRTKNNDSPPKEVIVRGVRKHFHIAVSPLLLGEIYEKMTEVLNISEELAVQYISLLRKAGRLYADIDNDEIIWCDDPSRLLPTLVAMAARIRRGGTDCNQGKLAPHAPVTGRATCGRADPPRRKGPPSAARAAARRGPRRGCAA
jgi:hypothetical protein